MMNRSNLAYKILFFLILFLVLSTLGETSSNPSLVIVIVVDQFRPDYLERFEPYFVPDGFRRFLNKGIVYRQARHRHAITDTAPSHASIGSGYDARNHGIVGNQWYDPAHKRIVYSIESPQDRMKHLPSRYLMKPAVGEILKQKFPRSRVVSLAIKDRTAILLAGRNADAVLWFNSNKAAFVPLPDSPSSINLLPFNEKLPAFFESIKSWEPSAKVKLEEWQKITFDPHRLLHRKDDSNGMGASFPHPLQNVEAILSSPYGNDLLLGFGRFAIDTMKLGNNPSGAPDLLFLGLSSSDYYGHMFGPDSMEVADGVIRLDESLQDFFQQMDSSVKRPLIFLTSDHGITPLPEITQAKQGKADPSSAGRFPFMDGSEERLELEKYLAKKFDYELNLAEKPEDEHLVLHFIRSQIYMNDPVIGRKKLDRKKVEEEVKRWLLERKGILHVYTGAEIERGLPPNAPFAAQLRRCFYKGRSGDIIAILRPGWIFDFVDGKGTDHGQPHDDNSRVPLLVWRPGLKPVVLSDSVTPLSIVKTIAALYGFRAGAEDVTPLKPVLAATKHGEAQLRR
jgi:predicted AlkP superfamily pyrophosphatase or phosphodiesterase